MSDLGEADTGAVYYRTKDNIKNFKIRVRLGNAATSTLVADAGSSESNDEVCIVSWQEKLFSDTEFQKYADETKCKSELDRRYNENIKKMKEAKVERPNKRIFTFTDYDAFDTKQSNKRFTTAIGGELSKLAEKVQELKTRRGGTQGNKNKSSSRGVPRTNLVEDEPSAELIKKNHYVLDKSLRFYIMADMGLRELKPGEEATDAAVPESPSKRKKRPAVPNVDDDPVVDAINEGRYIVLCVIKFDPRGIVSVDPNFNPDRKYTIESDFAVGGSCQYTIENFSPEMTMKDLEHEQRMHRELYNRHKDFMAARVGREFEMPHPEVLRVLVFGEIVSARNFEYDHLYVRYLIDLPHNWFVMPTQPLSGVSQICNTKTEAGGRDDIAYFGFPFEMQLFYKNVMLDVDKQDVMPRWPTVIFEVSSVDSWNRQRVEGYSFVYVPPTPGLLEQRRLDCWRPVGSSIANDLRRFFIGGAPELEDPTYPAIPSTFGQGSVLSKFGLRTQTTGSLHIRLHSMHQSHVSLDGLPQVEASEETALSRNLTQTARRSDVLDVIAEYNRSRTRLHQVRQMVNFQLGDLEKLRMPQPLDPLSATAGDQSLEQEAQLFAEAVGQQDASASELDKSLGSL